MLLSLSRTSFEKNPSSLSCLCASFERRDKVRDWFVVAGDGPYLDSLKEQAGEIKLIQKHV